MPSMKFESDEVRVERPGLPAMDPDPDATGQADTMEGGAAAERSATSSSRPDRPEAPEDVEPADVADQVASEGGGPAAGGVRGVDAGGGQSYVRLLLRVEDGETTVQGASRVDGPLVTQESAGGAYAYEVTFDGRRLAGDALGDLGTWRSFPDPEHPERGHHETELDQYDFTVRIPTEKLPRDGLDRVEIALLKVTDSSRDLPAIGDRPLLDRFPVELREVSRFGGSELAGELERLLP